MYVYFVNVEKITRQTIELILHIDNNNKISHTAVQYFQKFINYLILTPNDVHVGCYNKY